MRGRGGSALKLCGGGECLFFYPTFSHENNSQDVDRTLIHTGNAVGLVGPGRLRLKAFTLRVLGLIFTALSGPGLPPREFLPLGEEAGVRFPQQWLVIEFIGVCEITCDEA